MSTLRWSGFGSFIVDEHERFHVSYNDIGRAGFTLMHEMGRGDSHSVGHAGAYPTLAAAEASAVAHVTKAVATGRPCYLF